MTISIKQPINASAYMWFFYSLGCYLASLISLSCFIVFVSGIYEPMSVNAQMSKQPLISALLSNTALIALFGFQHSIMARKRFKTWLRKCLPETAERSTYCLASSIALLAIPLFWTPMNGQIWDVSETSYALFIYGIGGAGWLLLLISTFQLDHFELFGLKQSYFQLIGKVLPESEFRKPGLYKVVRHPIQLGVLIGVWAVPVSTVNHVMLASGMTAYIFVGLYFEEKELVLEFGQRYKDYKQQVAKLIPFIG